MNRTSVTDGIKKWNHREVGGDDVSATDSASLVDGLEDNAAARVQPIILADCRNEIAIVLRMVHQITNTDSHVMQQAVGKAGGNGQTEAGVDQA